MLAGLLALVAAGLVVGGSFGAITEYRNSYRIDDDPSVYATSTTWWGFHDAGSSSPVEEESVLTGLTLVLAGALLVLGAVFAFVAARTRTSGPVSGSRSLISAGVGVIAGVTVLQLLAVLKQMDRYNEQELDAGESLEFTAGLGLWLPLGGLVLGVVAVVLAHVGQRSAAARVEPNTPRMGFPAPYGYRPQPPVAERPTDVQISDEDAAADTQVVSAATASGADAPAPAAPVTPSSPAPVVPPAAVVPPAPVAPPVTPATTAVPEPSTSPASSAEAPATQEAESPAAAPPVTPATTSVPEQAPAQPSTPATSSAEAPASPATPAAPATPAESPATPPADAAPAAPAEPAAAPATEPRADAPTADKPAEAAKPTPLSDLPAAPPAPELSSPDDKSDK